MNDRPHPTDYAPYHTLPGFQRGIDDYMSCHFDNPYTEPRESLKAQAWDRGLEYAMLLTQWNEGNPS